MDRFIFFRQNAHHDDEYDAWNLWHHMDQAQSELFGDWNFPAVSKGSSRSGVTADEYSPTDETTHDWPFHQGQNNTIARANEKTKSSSGENSIFAGVVDTATLVGNAWAEILAELSSQELTEPESSPERLLDDSGIVEEVEVDVVNSDFRHLEKDGEYSSNGTDEHRELHEEVATNIVTSDMSDLDESDESFPMRENATKFFSQSQPFETDGNTLTIGVEFEFLVPREDIHVSDRPQRYFISLQEQTTLLMRSIVWPAQLHIKNALNKAGIRAHILSEDPIPGETLQDVYSMWIISQERSLEYDPGSDSDESLYSVYSPDKEDFRMVDDFALVGLEVSSRKLPANEFGFREIERVLHTLRSTTLMHINDKCGLHIHVDANSLSLTEKKDFVCLYMMVESTLFQFCAPQRRGVDGYSQPVTKASKVAMVARNECERTGKKFLEGLSQELHQLLHRARNHAGLQERLLEENKTRCTLALKHVGGNPDDERYTFEFRQLQGSLDPELVRHWAQVCVALVFAARGLDSVDDSSRARVYDLFYRIGNSEDINAWRELLVILDLEDAIEFWQRKLLTYMTPAGWSQNETGNDGFATVLP